MAGKLDVPGRLNAVAAGSLVYVTDQASSRRFLIDTGASFSILPHQSSARPSGPNLSGPDGQPIACWGDRTLHLVFSGQQFKWTFLLADVKFPIIGVDFLRAHMLIVDPAAGRLLATATGAVLDAQAYPSGATASVVLPRSSAAQFTAVERPGAAAAVAAVAAVHGGDFSSVLADFPEVLNPSKRLPPVSHDVEHFLETRGPPISSKFRRLDAVKFAAAKAEFAQLERDGIVVRSKSPWSSPLHMVEKPDGSWRPCGDYRRLNLVTVPDSYPIPNIMDFSARVVGCRVFSKLDLRKGYHQIPMHPADVEKTAIATPFGLFEFRRMTFGLRNAGNTFQRFMDRTLDGMDAAFAYLDDVLIGSADWRQHELDVRDVLTRLQTAGLVLNAEKCIFAVEELDFLGHHVTAGGFTPLLSSVDAILLYPRPSTVKQLQAFLGVINFYRRFVPAAARVLKPLTEALKGSPKPATVLDWTPEMDGAVHAAKAALSKATLLAHPLPAAELGLAVDASADHVGAVLQQRTAAWQPLGFFSKKLEPAQIKYSAFDRELLACCLGIRHFRFMVEGRKFAVFTDHKPLTHALFRVQEPWTARQSRQLSYVAEFTGDIRHVPGVENLVADALSRPPEVNTVAASAAGLDYRAIAVRQKSCAVTMKTAAGSSLRVLPIQLDVVSLLCDISQGGPRPLIPVEDRRAVFAAFHGMAHLGARATRRLMTARVVWRGMSSDIAAWVRDCQDCGRSKVTRQPAVAPAAIPVPDRRFSHVHIDLVGPLPTSAEGFQYLLTMVDRSTRWLEAVPLRSMDVAACADAFVHSWIARFGVPAVLTSDQGAQFTSAVWARLCAALGVQHNTTTAYHPQSNGMVERSHRQLKDALRARLAGVNWYQHLPWVLLGLRAAPKEDSAVSSAELVYGASPSLPGEFLIGGEKAAAEFWQRLQAVEMPPTRKVTYADAAATPSRDLQEASHVYVRRGGVLPPLQQPYLGPFQVIKRNSKCFVLKMGSRMETVSVDRLKAHKGAATVQPAVPPRRGRPPLK